MIADCWNKIGVAGDRTCPELETVTHCHNCPVYATGGRSLLDRAAPEGYIDEWTNLLAQRKSAESVSQSSVSVLIFRLKGEWIALPTKIFKEVTPPCVIHTLPHRSNELFLGLGNIRGEIQLCIALDLLLGIETTTSPPDSPGVVYQRMVVVEKAGDTWVFPVDEIAGVHPVQPHQFQDVPTVIDRHPETYTKAIIDWDDLKINFLDEQLLFDTLKRRIL
ncbi:MAG: chemotaxis protein CheW [Hormoscilla sp.]